MERKKNQIVYNQMELCKEIANEYQGTYNLNDIRNIIEKLEQCVKLHLAEADEKHSIQVKLLNGVSLMSWLIPAQKNANVFGVNTDINEYVRVKSDVTHYYKRKVNELSYRNKVIFFIAA